MIEAKLKCSQVVRDLERGFLSINEAEREMESICMSFALQADKLDDRLRIYAKMKRYCWRMLLKSTKDREGA